ncbi:hypothetical protein AK812_SmicGene47463, partial [Symbiodinium microadriaticum]
MAASIEDLTGAERLRLYQVLIPPASESDLLRLYLLAKYGGAWVDAARLT